MKSKAAGLWRHLAVRSCLLNILITVFLIGVFSSVSVPGADLLGIPGLLGAAISFMTIAFLARRKNPETARKDSLNAAVGTLAGTLIIIVVVGILFYAELNTIFSASP